MKLFGSGRSGPARLGVFGKLPTYGDFMSQHADSAEAQSLAKWLQEGVGQGASAQTQDQFLHFIWEPKKSRGRALVGCLWPSADSAGRRFPFALFTSVPAEELLAHGGRRVIAAEPIWRQMHDLHAQLLTIGDLSAQYAMLQETKPAAPLGLAAAEQTYTDRARTSSLQGAQRVAVALHLRDLITFAQTVRGAGSDLAFAARLRVHGHVDPDIEAATWLQILSGQLGNRDPSGALFVRVSLGDGQRSVTLFHRDMTATDLGYLLAPPQEYRLADPVGYRTVTSSPEDVTFREAFDRRWGSRSSVYATLLDLGLMGWTPADMAAASATETVRGHAGDLTAAVATEPISEHDVTGPTDDSDDMITGEIVMDSPGEDDGDITGPIELPDPPTGEAETGAAAVVASPEPATDDADAMPEFEETGESDEPEPAAAPPADEPTANGDPTDVADPTDLTDPADAADATDPTDTAEGSVGGDHGALVTRIRDLASSGLRSGRIVRISGGAAEDGEIGGPELLVYVESGAASGRPLSAETPLAEQIATQIESHDEARRLLEELAGRHRQLETELEEQIIAACMRPASEASS